MKLRIFKGSLFVILILLALISACSDSSTNSNGKPAGDTDNPAYVAAKEVLDDADGGLTFAFIYTWIMYTMTRYEAPEPPVYHAASGYWYRTDTQSEGAMTATLIDSFQLWHGATPVQYADSALLTRIVGGFHMHGYDSNTFDTVIANYDLTITGPAGDVYTGDSLTGNISGNYYAHVHGPIEGHDSLGTCLVEAHLTSGSTSMKFNLWDLTIDDMYPYSGKYSESGSIYVDPPDPADNVVTGNPWKSGRTFTGGYISKTVYENETNSWTVSDTLDIITK